MSSDVQNPQNNGAVLTIAQIIDTVMSSAAEAELGALFKCQRSSPHAMDTAGNGAPSASNSHPNR
jgi:hypothetical protein